MLCISKPADYLNTTPKKLEFEKINTVPFTAWVNVIDYLSLDSLYHLNLSGWQFRNALVSQKSWSAWQRAIEQKCSHLTKEFDQLKTTHVKEQHSHKQTDVRLVDNITADESEEEFLDEFDFNEEDLPKAIRKKRNVIFRNVLNLGEISFKKFEGFSCHARVLEIRCANHYCHSYKNTLMCLEHAFLRCTGQAASIIRKLQKRNNSTIVNNGTHELIVRKATYNTDHDACAICLNPETSKICKQCDVALCCYEWDQDGDLNCGKTSCYFLYHQHRSNKLESTSLLPEDTCSQIIGGLVECLIAALQIGDRAYYDCDFLGAQALWRWGMSMSSGLRVIRSFLLLPQLQISLHEAQKLAQKLNKARCSSNFLHLMNRHYSKSDFDKDYVYCQEERDFFPLDEGYDFGEDEYPQEIADEDESEAEALIRKASSDDLKGIDRTDIVVKEVAVLLELGGLSGFLHSASSAFTNSTDAQKMGVVLRNIGEETIMETIRTCSLFNFESSENLFAKRYVKLEHHERLALCIHAALQSESASTSPCTWPGVCFADSFKLCLQKVVKLSFVEWKMVHQKMNLKCIPPQFKSDQETESDTENDEDEGMLSSDVESSLEAGSAEEL